MRDFRLFLIVAATVALVLRPSAARAQLEFFTQGARALVDAAGRTEPARSNDTRAAAGRMRTALADWDHTIAGLEAHVDRDSRGATDENAYQLHVQLGVAYRLRGRLADALRQFDAAAAHNASASDLHVLRALTLEALGRTDDAGKAFVTAWSRDLRDPVKAYYVTQRTGAGSASDRQRALALLTETYDRLGAAATRPAAPPFVTLAAIPDTLSRTPVVADEPAADGFALLNAGKLAEGVAALAAAGETKRATTADSPLAHFLQGQRDEASNRVADARREYQAAVRATLAGRSVLLVAIARLAQVDDDLPAAVAAFAEAVRLNPNDPNIHKELAGAYTAIGRPDDALCELIAALLVDPRDGQAYGAIGQVFLDTGRSAEAVVAFSRALDVTPDHYEARYGLATAHARLGHTAEAARELDIFDRLRRDALERRRRDIASEVEGR